MKLIIKQRDYIVNHLKTSDFEGIDLDHVKGYLDSADIYEVRADLDCFQILAQIAQEDNAEMLMMADPMKGVAGVHELGDFLIEKFINELRHRRTQTFIDDPLAEGEMPEEIQNFTKLVLVPEYFIRNESGFRLPPLLKRVKAESDVQYEMRVKNHLLKMSDQKFE